MEKRGKVLIIFLLTCMLVLSINLVSASCVDSDNGKNYQVKGTTSSEISFILFKTNAQKQDFCVSDKVLKEYYCENNKLRFINYVCECLNGVCIDFKKPEEKIEKKGFLNNLIDFLSLKWLFTQYAPTAYGYGHACDYNYECATCLFCNVDTCDYMVFGTIEPACPEPHTCNGVGGCIPPSCTDGDNDGFGICPNCGITNGCASDGDDCDDSNPLVYPGATELCNEIDDDCDGEIDEGVKNTYYQDSDGDGYGNPSVSFESCTPSEGYVTDNTDCDDSNINIWQYLNGYFDSDDDGFGAGFQTQVCSGNTLPDGYVTDNTDCDDSDIDIYPGATEVCDYIDNNCDGETDEGLQTTTWYQDRDEDGFGSHNNIIMGCAGSPPPGQVFDYVLDDTDCDDSDANIKPGATEVCDGVDNDCDGQIDEGCNCINGRIQPCGSDEGECQKGTQTCVNGNWGICVGEITPVPEVCDSKDNDCDGIIDGLTQTCGSDIGECVAGTSTCVLGAWSSCVGEVGPTTEICDNKDNNCNGQTDESLTESTTCGVGACAGNTGTKTCTAGAWTDTCDPLAGATTETCNNLDDDCDGSVDESLTESTTCGVGACAGNTGTKTCTAGAWTDTCDPYEGAVDESCEDETGYDGIDNNCDGTIDLDCDSYCDQDGDDYSDNLFCVIFGGYFYGDCDDTNADINAGENELCDNIDNDCDSGTEDGTDESWYHESTTCGVGECESQGQYECSSGTKTDTCQAGTPTTEICDYIDNNCDGQTDEDVLITFYRDSDGDGYGDISQTTLACTPPTGYVTDNTDCDDSDENEWKLISVYVDNDEDGYGTGELGEVCLGNQLGKHSNQGGDCDDTNPEIKPGATEVCDGVDNNCDGQIDEGCFQCNDGIDNDNDNLIDYPSDPGCSSLTDDSEQDIQPACSDSTDNDGDGLVDYPSDPGCDSPTDNDETNGGTSCFLAGTKILMSDYSEKNIEDVKIGDYVVSYDEERKEKVIAKVLELESPVRNHLCKIELLDKSILELTNEHPVYTITGWKSINPEETKKENAFLIVNKLIEGDLVLTSEDNYKIVKEINCWNEIIQTYNLKSIENTNTYYAEKILVHNKGGGGGGGGGNRTCGDGTVQNPNDEGKNETCDLGANNGAVGSGCTSDCKNKTYCGDGIKQALNGDNKNEECDEGLNNGADGSFCSSDCKNMTYCGDGIIQKPNYYGVNETCDKGTDNGKPESECASDCTLKCVESICKSKETITYRSKKYAKEAECKTPCIFEKKHENVGLDANGEVTWWPGRIVERVNLGACSCGCKCGDKKEGTWAAAAEEWSKIGGVDIVSCEKVNDLIKQYKESEEYKNYFKPGEDGKTPFEKEREAAEKEKNEQYDEKRKNSQEQFEEKKIIIEDRNSKEIRMEDPDNGNNKMTRFIFEGSGLSPANNEEKVISRAAALDKATRYLTFALNQVESGRKTELEKIKDQYENFRTGGTALFNEYIDNKPVSLIIFYYGCEEASPSFKEEFKKIIQEYNIPKNKSGNPIISQNWVGPLKVQFLLMDLDCKTKYENLDVLNSLNLHNPETTMPPIALGIFKKKIEEGGGKYEDLKIGHQFDKELTPTISLLGEIFSFNIFNSNTLSFLVNIVPRPLSIGGVSTGLFGIDLAQATFDFLSSEEQYTSLGNSVVKSPKIGLAIYTSRYGNIFNFVPVDTIPSIQMNQLKKKGLDKLFPSIPSLS